MPRLGVATCASPYFPNLGPIFRASVRSAISTGLALRAKLIGLRPFAGYYVQGSAVAGARSNFSGPRAMISS
jgi:hypothetical protein